VSNHGEYMDEDALMASAFDLHKKKQREKKEDK
jgi:hypothetical protein